MRLFKTFPVHPILFGIYPILALLAHNIEQIKPIVSLRSILFVLIGMIFFFALLYLILRDEHRVAVICSLLIFLFFSYGHVYDLLGQLDSPIQVIARHRYLLPIWLCLCLIGLWLIRRNKAQIQASTPYLNIIGVIILILPLSQIVFYQVRMQYALSEKREAMGSVSDLNINLEEVPPDIYYIILDAYTRGDILEDVYHLDNSSFLQSLRDMGFYVADCSQSNYAQTELSMSATFNMDYLENLDSSFVSGSTDRSGLWPLLRYGKVRELLEENGYLVVTFESGYYWIQWEDADLYLSLPKSASIGNLFRESGLNSFESMLIKSTASRVFLDTTVLMDFLDSFLPDVEYYEKVVRERTLMVLDQLQPDRVPGIKGPKFIYAHIIAPHPPYVFGPEGEYAKHGEEFTYSDQVTYINKRILEVVAGIIENSEKQPIIILQGDHGLRQNPEERVAILNAYYFPDGRDQDLYPWITPVNTFRLIFDDYLGTEFGLLEDKSYFSSYELPYDFEMVPNTCRTE